MLQALASLLTLAADPPGGRRPRHRYHRRPPQTQEELGVWIWIKNAEPARNSYIQARKLFNLRANPDKAIIKAAADTSYKLYVNGRYVGKGPVPSGAGYSYYDTHDVTSLLTKGDNVIAFLVHHVGENTYSRAAGKPGLLCKVEIETGDERQIIATDTTWRVRRATEWTNQGVRISKGLGFQEVYDASQRLEDWHTVRFKEKGWEDAAVMGAPPAVPWGRIIPRQIPALREEKLLPNAVVGVHNSPPWIREVALADVPKMVASSRLAPLRSGSVKDADALLSEKGHTHVSTPRSDAGVVILLDFGKEVFGNVEIGVAGSASGCIDLSYGELLEDGHVNPTRGECKYADRVVLSRGELAWQGFEPRAFRYLQMEFRGFSKAAVLDYVRVNQTTYPVGHTGAFECSDDLLNRIWQAGAYTTRLCMQNTFIDAPWRERGQWWADARIESRSAYYAFDDMALLAQGLRQFAEAQRHDGAIPGLCPAGEEKIVPDFALLWVFSILDYYAFSDDVELLREIYPSIRRLMGWFEGHLSEDGLLANVPGDLFIDAVELADRGEVTGLNCLCYQALRVTAVIASILGIQSEADSYLEAASRLRLAINGHLYSPERALYAECRVDGKLVEEFARQANILAALFDIPEYYQKSTILRLISEGALPETETPYFESFFLEALYSLDRHQEALDLIRGKWGPMLQAGGGTLWESFDQEGSLCQGWSVCPTRDLTAEYLGIKPILGSHRFSVTPHIADLEWARGAINTKSGPLEVEWRCTSNYLLIGLRVPQGLRVDVYPPAAPTSRIMLDGKAQPSRFLTLGGGAHEIKVVATRPPRPAKLDESLKPTPVPHVEVLEGIPRRFRMLESMPGDRRRGRRPTSRTAAESEAGAETVAAEETLESAVGVEPTEAAPARRSRRGSRRPPRPRKPGGKESPQQPQATPEPTQEAAPTPVPEPSADQKPAAPRRRRRHSRGGGPRSAEQAEAAPEPQPQPVQEPAPEASGEPKAHRRRRYTRRGGAKRKPESPEQGS